MCVLTPSSVCCSIEVVQLGLSLEYIEVAERAEPLPLPPLAALENTYPFLPHEQDPQMTILCLFLLLPCLPRSYSAFPSLPAGQSPLPRFATGHLVPFPQTPTASPMVRLLLRFWGV